MIEGDDCEWFYHLVEPEQAHAVAVVQMTIPNVSDAAETRYYLADSRRRRVITTVESVTVNLDGSITETGTLTFEDNVELVLSSYGDGRTADGRGFGCNTSIHFTGRQSGTIVHLTASWRAPDGSCGEFDEELVVPWTGAARVELGGGTAIEAEVIPVGATT